MSRALTFVLLLAACGGDVAPTVLDAGSDLEPSPDLAPTIPSTHVGAALSWFLMTENGDVGAIDGTSVGPHFSAAFLAQVPANSIAGGLISWAALQPFSLLAIEPGATDTKLIADLATGDQTKWRLTLATDATGLIDGIFSSPAPDLDSALSTWSGIDTKVSGLAESGTMLAAELTASGCQPIHALDATTARSLGSEFKLYVLATLGAAVHAGTMSWTTMLAIRDDWKSLPSGTFQNDPAGTMHTILEFAQNMISVSDNTATDHLLRTLTREAVEMELPLAGMAAPARDVPFLTTRDLFIFKLALSSMQQQTYLGASADDRRTQLDNLFLSIPIAQAAQNEASWTAPRFVDEMEWFASPTDICSVFSTIKGLADLPGGKTLYDILSINPGIGIDSTKFPYVGFKGGSEPGVLTSGWLLRRADGRWFVVSVMFNDTQSNIDEERAIYYSAAAIDLVSRQP